jgi:hypothetical protein
VQAVKDVNGAIAGFEVLDLEQGGRRGGGSRRS